MEEMEKTDYWEEAASDDEIGNDDRAHNKMLAAIGALDDKNRARQLLQRTEPAAVSEFHVPTSEGQVKVHELVVALKSTSANSDLKKQLNRVQKRQKTLTTPLSKPEQERIERNVAYEKTSVEISKWDSVVHSNRKAPQMQFPLERPHIHINTTTEFVKKFQPHTALEKEVAALLRSSSNVLTGGSELTEAERQALKAMSIEEARERRTELQKYRVLLSFKEAKAHRQKKIKSKRFHRVLRKERLKGEQKIMDELKRSDPEAYTEKLEQTERTRMQERMSLKHRGGSKFMKQQMVYGKYDDKSRESVQEMLQKSRELSQKRKNADGDGESSEDDVVEMVVDDTANVTPLSGVVEQNPWMNAKVKVRKTALEPVVNSEVNSMAQDLEEHHDETSVDVVTSVKSEDVGGSSYNDDSKPNQAIDDIFSSIGQRENKKKTPQKTAKKSRKTRTKKKRKTRGGELATGKDVESLDGGKNTKTIVHDLSDYVHEQSGGIRMSLTRRKAQEDFEGDMSDDEADATPTEAPKKIERPKSPAEDKDKLVVAVDIDPKKFFTVGKALTRSKAPDLVADDDEGGFIAEDEQRMTIAQAFASDDVVEEFQQEKKTAETRDVPKDIDLSLPGWGSWAGAGLVPSKRKRGRLIIKAPQAKPRKDSGLHNVIISETKDNSVAKHQVSHLPFPFSSVHQFESSVRQPIGKTWNPETAYHQLIKPKVVTRLGTIIEPISKEATFKKEKEKSGFLAKDGGKRKLDIVGKKQPAGKKARGQRGGKRKK